MPQFDTQWYLSEILWFLLCFGVLYFVMAYFIYPLIQDIFLEREHKIKNDLSVAEVINKQAAKLIQNYKTRIYSAEQVKAEIMNETYRDIQKYVAHIDTEHEQRFRQQIEDTEKKVRQQKEDVIRQSNIIANQIALDLAQKLSHPKSKKVAK